MPNPTHTPGELKACPFCGGEADCIHKPMEGTYSIECHDCLAQMPYVGLTSEEAITAWNHRTVDTELLEALKKARTTISILRTNVLTEIGRCADPSESRWEGVPEQLAKRLANIDAAITKATGHG